jgi:serine/threonine protein kinase, bacterial
MSMRPMCAPGVAKDLRMPLANGATAAGFRIIRQLGSGGMGEVYLAEHPRLPRHDALKILPPGMSADPEFRERFNRESDLTAALSHPHIVGVHDRGEFEGQLWISMDYVDGADAAHLLRESYPTGMPPDDVVEIVTAIAGALDYAHDRGLLHRDVKPGNILITQPAASGARRILLADFGVARRIDDVSGLTQTNMVVGTVSYTAPEQLMGRAIDGRADQYALAATAFHLLTGSPPFSDRNPAVVISQHLSGPPPRVGDARPELAPLDRPLSRALATDPAGRFPRCQDFAEALAACHNKPLSTPDAGPTVRAPSPAPAPTSPRDTGTAAPAARATPAPTSRRDAGVAAPALRRAPTAAAPRTRERPPAPVRRRWLRPVRVVLAILALLIAFFIFMTVRSHRPSQPVPPAVTTPSSVTTTPPTSQSPETTTPSPTSSPSPTTTPPTTSSSATTTSAPTSATTRQRTPP